MDYQRAYMAYLYAYLLRAIEIEGIIFEGRYYPDFLIAINIDEIESQAQLLEEAPEAIDAKQQSFDYSAIAPQYFGDLNVIF